MRIHRRTIAVALSTAFALTTPGLGQETGAGARSGGDAFPGATVTSSEQSDRVLLRKLVRRVRRVDRETTQVTAQAMEEARRNGGTANPETKARLLSLRDERDRIFSRMLVLSMRYGWAIPAVDAPSAAGADRQEAENSIFGSVDAILRKQFASEAGAIASRVRLPVVSLARTAG